MIRRIVLVGTLGVLLVVAYFGVTFFQVLAASRRGDPPPAQAIVVLGAAQYNGRPSPVFRARLDHAAALYEEGVAPVVVLTGGRQPGDSYTEASAAAGYLQGKGISPEALRLETQSHNSWQSLAAAARFLQEEGITDVVLVSSPYHSLRIEGIAGEVGLSGRASPARAAGFDLPRLLRESLAVGVGRVIGYGRLVDLDDRVGRVREPSGSR